MLDLKHTQESLNKFAKYVIQQSRRKLTKEKKNASRSLYKSLDYVLSTHQNSFRLSFLMDEHGKFIDKGVKGADPSNLSPNTKKRGQQAPNSPYRFGSGSHKGTWGDFVDSLESWVKLRNVRFRDPKGRFKKGSYRSVAYVTAKNIYARGIAPTYFFSEPFEKAFNNLPDDLVDRFALDIEEFLKYTTEKNK